MHSTVLVSIAPAPQFRAWRRPRTAMAALLMLHLAVASVPAVADPSPGASVDGWKTVIKYTSCAMSIIAARDVAGIAAAISDCAHTLSEEFQK